MAPVAANGVAAIAYTPFADASSRWFIVRASSDGCNLSPAESVVGPNLIYTSHAARGNQCAPCELASSTISARCLRVHLVRYDLIAIVQWMFAGPARGDLHDPICAFGYRCAAGHHVCVRPGAAAASHRGRWHVRAARVS